MVIVDTCVWSLALRRRSEAVHPTVDILADLIQTGRAVLLGLVRQELLSGIRDGAQFITLRDHLRAFPDLDLHAEDFEEAAVAFNSCRAQGVQGSTIDFLLCGVALRRDLPILTVDTDFQQYARVLSFTLYGADTRT